jgi:hypothetical protein
MYEPEWGFKALTHVPTDSLHVQASPDAAAEVCVDNMAEIPGRKSFSRHLTSAYKAVAERTLEVKTQGSRKAREEATRNGMTTLRLMLE